MRTLEMLKEKKKQLKLTNQEIADLSGIPLGTVQKVLSGATKSPGSRTLAAIEKVLYPADPASPELLKESTAAYASRYEEEDEEDGRKEKGPEGEPGPYTYADYAALPDDRRVELIDGWFYDMAAPRSKHQLIIGQLHLQFQACAEGHPDCMVWLSPLDVMLDGDDRTVVQPDLLVICDRSKMRKGRVFGAPDLVVEVISPGSRKMDYGRKTMKYLEAGVREYWIIDEKTGRVFVYRNEDSVELSMHTMRDEIPVGISGGKCRINMGKIQALLDELGDI